MPTPKDEEILALEEEIERQYAQYEALKESYEEALKLFIRDFTYALEALERCIKQ